MAQWLKQSTQITVKIGPFVDSTDGNTVEGGLTLTQPDIRLSKNGAAFAQKNAAQTLTHDENGYYGLTLDTTDTATLGRLTVHVHETGALPVWHEFMVVPANVWDSFFASDALQVHAVEITNGLITAAAIANGAIDAATFAAGAIDAAAIAGDAGNEIADAVMARALAAESYAADGAAPTLSQILYMIWAGIAEVSVSGTTMTVKKLDGSTTAMTFTLDDAVNPASRTRAS